MERICCKFFAALWIICLSLLSQVYAEVYTMEVSIGPENVVAGEAFGTKPLISVFDSKGILAVELSGSVYVEIGSSPVQYEPLWLGECNVTSCGRRVIGDMAKVVLNNGIANFENLDLQIRQAGVGYTLRFIVLNVFGVPLAFTYSDEFEVSVGDPYTLSLDPIAGPFIGGLPFGIQPTVRIVDRGGNIVDSINEGIVFVDLHKSPHVGEELLSNGTKSSSFEGGIAKFEGLYINRAGGPYGMIFNCSLNLEGVSVVLSEDFTVAVGPPAQLLFVENITSAPIQAGEFLTVPPHFQILDNGGNLLHLDSMSEVRVQINDLNLKDSNARVGPPSHTAVRADMGIVRMSALRIDAMVGPRYRLAFYLYRFDASSRLYDEEPTVAALSDEFYLELGPPRKIVPQIYAANAWAGGQSFDVQPVISIVDSADNPMVNDSVSNISAVVVTSLSEDTEERRIVIDTSDANATIITRVSLNVANGTYGAGEEFDFVVTFEYEVWVEAMNDNATDPFIVLNIENDDGSQNVSAFLNRNFTDKKTNVLVFTYIVSPGDSREGISLDYASSTLFVGSNSNIVDGNGYSVDLSLPYFSKTVYVNTTMPYIVSFSTNKTDGEYGTGEHIYLLAEYNFPVRVLGSPYLALNINDTFGIEILRNASYWGIENGNKTLVFRYKVESFDMANKLSLRNSSIQWSPTRRWHDPDTIRRLSTYPLTPVVLEIPSSEIMAFNVNEIVIDTTPPQLNASYGLQTSNMDGWYYPGDVLEFSLQFTKQVAYTGISIELLLYVGGPKIVGQATILELADDNKTMSFVYNVTEGVNTTALDIFPTIDFAPALRVFGWPSYIRRLSTEPTEDAILNTSFINSTAGNALAGKHEISVYGIQPVVTSVTAFADNNTAPFTPGIIHVYRGDIIFINVSFNAPVFPTCDDPVVVMQTLHTFRKAVLVSGAGTNLWTFQYTVELGDDSPTGLYYRHLPNALCPDSECSASTSCKILTSSSTATMEIDYVMPWRGRDPRLGWRISSDIIVHPSYRDGEEANTTVVGATLNHESGVELGVGEPLVIQLQFSDDVFIGDADFPPRLLFTSGRNMTYSGGHGSKILSFLTYVKDGDDIDVIDIMAADGTNSAIFCTDECSLFNHLGEDVNLTTISVHVNATVSIDTSAPTVVDCWTDKNSSQHGGWYGAGESIFIFLRFNKPVLVTTYGVRLRLDVSDERERYALSDHTRSHGHIVAFEYIVEWGDYTADLMYDGTDALERHNDHHLSRIYRQSPILSTEASYVLPSPATLSVHAEPIAIDSFIVPIVTNVVSLNEDSRYAVGDKIDISVTFSHHVQVFGNPFLYLNGGDRTMKAHYQEVEDNAPSTSVLFTYIVSENDYSHNLDYVDVFSLQRGYTIEGYRGSILLTSTYPTTNATLDLPSPGAVGSLGYNNKIIIDGYPSFMTAIDFVTKEDAIYGLGDVIQIVMNFSTPVEVVGHPTILMETGNIDREAVYTAGNGTDSIIFEYIPQPGDSTNRLDYAFDRMRLRSCVDSFNSRGSDGTGGIYTLSANSSLPAHIHLNPQQGELLGSKSMKPIEGSSYFFDLQIHYQGPDYEIRYFSTPLPLEHSTFTTTQILSVSSSNEFQLRPALATKDDRIGWAVDTDGEVTVVGAPHSNKIVKDVQTVTTTLLPNTKIDPVLEVQLMRIEMDHIPEIQSFHTTAAVYADVGGYFTLDYESLGPTRPIPRNAMPEMLEVIIMRDIPKLGRVSVSREAYIYCACTGAYTWNITFHDLTAGTINPIVFNDNDLTGDGASVVGPHTIQNSSSIGGTFNVINDQGDYSPNIAYDADDDEIIAALDAIDIEALEVNIGATNVAGSRTWTITFGAIGPFGGSYEIPTLKSDASGITGGDAFVWHTTARQGRHGPANSDSVSGFSGGFTLEWRNYTTDFISYNASAADVELKLESLPVISNVTVNRFRTNDLVGFTWVISLDGTLKETPRGFEVDEHGPFEAFVAHNMLVGTNSTVVIGSKSNSDVSAYSFETRGLYGYNAGSVHVYQRSFDDFGHWREITTLVGNDTDTNDQFGSSVSLSGQVLCVGAMGAETVGVPEIQSIFCEANSGSFILEFRGWRSSVIPYNVSRLQLIELIQGDLGEMNNIHSMHSISIEDWGDGGLCDGNTARITIETPVDSVYGSDSGADLEEFTIVSNTLKYNTSNATIIITEEQKGTIKLHGKDSDGVQTGSAYVFRSELDCQDYSIYCNKKKWIQEAQFFPTDVTGQERFGHSISSTSRKIAVGAPGTLDGRGAVYVFMEETSKRWKPMGKKLTASVWVPAANDEFGYDVSLQADTLAIGTPGRDEYAGSVYIFRQNSNVSFVATQEVRPPLDLFTRSPGDRFGYSVAVDDDMLVVGAVGYDDATIYLGKEPSNVATDTGAVFVFRRYSGDYEFEQQLVPSNVRRFDGFGNDVAINKNTIVVGAVEDMRDGYVGSAPVLQVKLSADYNEEKIDGHFRLKWVRSNETGVWSQRVTRLMEKNISALDFRRALEADLSTGPLLVSRSNMDRYDGGYAWTVTFLSGSHRNTPNLEPVEDGLLTGTNPVINCTIVNPTPRILRGKSHVFTRKDSNVEVEFEEQAFLSPYRYEPVDRCGWSVAVAGDYTVVGCPNRDFWVLPNNNAGAAFMHRLDFLNLMFEDLAPIVTEGEWLNYSVIVSERDSREADIMYWVGTLDRNAFIRRQTLVSDLFGLHSGVDVIQYPETAIDTAAIAGTAVGRNQYYGSYQEDHKWVDGMYDYLAISDYAANDSEKLLLYEASTQYGGIKTTDDTLLENLDETFAVVIHSPGYWPSVLGRLTLLATIEDNWDGYVSINGSSYFQYDKVYAEGGVQGCESGVAIDIDGDFDILVNGCPGSSSKNYENAGKLFIYKQLFSHWTLFSVLESPNATEGGRFGTSAAIHTVYGRNITTLLVGEPGAYAVHVFESSGARTAWNYDATLTVNLTLVSQDKFADAGTVALYGDVAVIGAPGIEAVFVFTRRYSAESGNWTWSNPSTMRSSTYDVDFYLNTYLSHRQGFGTSVTMSGRTIVVGSPFADYDNIASPNTEVDWLTEGTDIKHTSRGMAFVYVSSAPVQNILLLSDIILDSGSFKLGLNYRDVDTNTTVLSWNTSASAMKVALEELENIDLVQVSYNRGYLPLKEGGTQGYFYSWQVTFLSEWEDPPLMTAHWNSTDCNDCEVFSDAHTLSNDTQITITQIQGYSPWNISHELSAGDKRRGDHFGMTVDLDDDLLAVGAINSAAVTTSTWDFEAGSLQGWSTTGDAFDYQPTWGDNSYYHALYRQEDFYLGFETPKASRTNPKGRYYVGTFEKRPGSKTDYRVADPDYPQGNTQGDEPTGTMESQIFQIGPTGTSISFLIGGGCDPNLEYVELLVDGLSISRETGKCKESMRRVSFDVRLFQLRMAQLRIVDMGKGPWGHINVDDFRFDWDNKGGQVNDTNSDSSREMFGGLVETSRSGAVHVFHRHESRESIQASKAVQRRLLNEMCSSCDPDTSDPVDPYASGLHHEYYSAPSPSASPPPSPPAREMDLIPDNYCTGDESLCSWSEVAKLTASDKRQSDRFGSSVAVNSAAGVIVVGSPYTGATGFYAETPSVYPYLERLNYADPQGREVLDVSDASGIHFPMSSQNESFLQHSYTYTSQPSGTHAVMKVRHDSNVFPDALAYREAGAVYVFTKQHEFQDHRGQMAFEAHWKGVEMAKIQPLDTTAQDHFGSSIALSGDLMAVGANGQDGQDLDSGAVYLYRTGFAAVRFSEAVFKVAENYDRQYASITIVRDLKIYDGLLVLEYATSDLTATGVDSIKYAECLSLPPFERGPAKCGDYEHTQGLMTIAAGDDRGTFTVGIIDDKCREHFMEFIQLTISVPGSASLQSEVLSAKLRIDDDDFNGVSEC